MDADLYYRYHHFIIYVSQTIMLNTLYSDVCQLFLNNTGNKQEFNKSSKLYEHVCVWIYTYTHM